MGRKEDESSSVTENRDNRKEKENPEARALMQSREIGLVDIKDSEPLNVASA
jgi:hypothetical protein